MNILFIVKVKILLLNDQMDPLNYVNPGDYVDKFWAMCLFGVLS